MTHVSRRLMLTSDIKQVCIAMQNEQRSSPASPPESMFPQIPPRPGEKEYALVAVTTSASRSRRPAYAYLHNEYALRPEQSE